MALLSYRHLALDGVRGLLSLNYSIEHNYLITFICRVLDRPSITAVHCWSLTMLVLYPLLPSLVLCVPVLNFQAEPWASWDSAYAQLSPTSAQKVDTSYVWPLGVSEGRQRPDGDQVACFILSIFVFGPAQWNTWDTCFCCNIENKLITYPRWMRLSKAPPSVSAGLTSSSAKRLFFSWM